MNEQEHAADNKPEASPGSKPDEKDDLKSIPMPEIRNWKWDATNAGKPV